MQRVIGMDIHRLSRRWSSGRRAVRWQGGDHTALRVRKNRAGQHRSKESQKQFARNRSAYSAGMSSPVKYLSGSEAAAEEMLLRPIEPVSGIKEWLDTGIIQSFSQICWFGLIGVRRWLKRWRTQKSGSI